MCLDVSVSKDLNNWAKIIKHFDLYYMKKSMFSMA